MAFGVDSMRLSAAIPTTPSGRIKRPESSESVREDVELRSLDVAAGEGAEDERRHGDEQDALGVVPQRRGRQRL